MHPTPDKAHMKSPLPANASEAHIARGVRSRRACVARAQALTAAADESGSHAAVHGQTAEDGAEEHVAQKKIRRKRNTGPLQSGDNVRARRTLHMLGSSSVFPTPLLSARPRSHAPHAPRLDATRWS